MDPATLALLEQIGSILFTVIKDGIVYGPAVISALEADYRLLTSGTALTDEQKAAAESNLQTAHAEYQAIVAANKAKDETQA